MKKLLLFGTMLIITPQTHASHQEECKKPACTGKRRVITITPQRAKELVPGAALIQFLGNIQKEVEKNNSDTATTQPYVNLIISKDEMQTLLSSGQDAAADLVNKPKTREFILTCSAIAVSLEKLTRDLPAFIEATYETSESGGAFLDLFFMTCMPNDEQAAQVKVEMLKSLARNKKQQELPQKQKSRCVIL